MAPSGDRPGPGGHSLHCRHRHLWECPGRAHRGRQRGCRPQWDRVGRRCEGGSSDGMAIAQRSPMDESVRRRSAFRFITPGDSKHTYQWSERWSRSRGDANPPRPRPIRHGLRRLRSDMASSAPSGSQSRSGRRGNMGRLELCISLGRKTISRCERGRSRCETQRARARASLTIRKRTSRPTDLLKFINAEPTNANSEQRSADRLEVVERRCAHARQTVLRSECDLRRDVADGSRHGRNDDRRQDRDRFVSGDNQNRSTLILGFSPPNLALLRHIHHGSSAIIRAVAASAHPVSASVCGVST